MYNFFITDTNLIPILNSQLACEFTKNRTCNEFWIEDNWRIKTNISLNFIPVLDSRWESNEINFFIAPYCLLINN